MDHQPSGAMGAPCSPSVSQCKAAKRPWDTSGDSPASLAPEEQPPRMPVTRTPANWDARDKEDSADSENPDEDFTGSGSPTSSVRDSNSLPPDSADLQSSEEEDFKDSDESLEGGSEGSERREEDPMDNGSPTEEHFQAAKNGKPAEQVSPAIPKSLKGRFTGATLDCQLPCTATEGKACQIFDHLSAWNEVLCQRSLLLRETTGTSGNLALVYDSEYGPAEYPSEQQRHQICTLAHWLLKTHCCIVRVDLDVFNLETYGHFLCNALQGNSHLRSLKLSFGGRNSGEDFALDILSLSHLEELECKSEPPAALVAKLPRLLRTSTSLTSLRISRMTLKGTSVLDIFRALKENRSLEELALSDSVIAKTTHAARAVFAEFLKKSTSLKTLSFAADCEECPCLAWILEALAGNKSVVSVRFKGLPVDQGAIRWMAKVFTQNRVLQNFTISRKPGYHYSRGSSVEDPPTESDFDHMHKSLAQNDTLEQVSLPIEFGDIQQWKALFEALSVKDSLKMLTIEARDGSDRSVLGISAALEGTGAEDRVSINTSFMDLPPDETFDCKALSEAVMCAANYNSTEVCKLLERLPSLTHIRSLQLELDDFRGGDEFHLAFTTCLAETRTLRKLTIGAAYDGVLDDLEDTIAKGVAISKSLREVCIRLDQVKFKRYFSDFAKRLAEAINASKNVSRVNLEFDGHSYVEHAFLQRLSVGIAKNYTLLSVNVGSVDKEAEVYWFRVWDAMRRNQGLVTAAADFVRGVRRDRHCALALEQVHRYPELVEEVARLESVDEARATALVREGFRTMVNMPDFM